MKTRIRSFIMAMLLVLSLTATSLAAGADSAVSLDLRANQVSDKITLSVYLTAQNSTNGRVEIAYNPNRAALVEVSTNDAWVTSINSATKGEVIFAWVGSAIATSANVVTLVFEVKNMEADITFIGSLLELNGTVLGSDEVTDTETIAADDTETETNPPVGPTNPPTPPQPPVDTEDKDDEEPDEGKDDEKTEGTPAIQVEVPEVSEEVHEAIVEQYSDADGHWAEDNIVKAINAGLFNGTSTTEFSPELEVDRGMFVTLLYRMSGTPEVEGENNYADVSGNQYYADAVVWASEFGIATGVSATEFDAGSNLTREQMVVMLYRFALYSGKVDNYANLSSFADAGQVSSWAMDAMRWAVAEGIIQGDGTNLNPGGESTRAEIATVLVRYIEKMGN